MDIRDIKEEPEEVKHGEYLEKIYELQKQLLDHYIGIEGLPQYPIDVNVKDNQQLLKDFTSRVIEELAEGYESHLLVKGIIDSVNGNLDKLSSEAYGQMISHLQNLNEEQADAMHFMVELLIYANILPEDINKWLDNYIDKLPIIDRENLFFDMYPGDIIIKAQSVGELITKDDYADINPIHCMEIAKTGELPGRVLDYIPGGRFYDEQLMNIYKQTLWDITYYLNIARNCLKNKPWKQSGVMTNERLYQDLLVKGFVTMMGYYYRLGIRSEQLYYLYFKKNKINQFRIASKY